MGDFSSWHEMVMAVPSPQIRYGAIFDGASPDARSVDTYSTCREEVICRLIISCVRKLLLSCVRKVYYAWPLVQWMKTYSFI
jgi:hypothetical protein